MDALNRLIAVEEIGRLKARYFYHLDHKDWDAWRDVFTDDAVMDVSSQFPDAPDPSVHMMHGATAIVQAVSGSLGQTQTVHHGHTPIIDVEAEDAATGLWALEDNLFFVDGSRMAGYGHYHERYRREGGRWKIAQTRLTRLKIVFTKGDARERGRKDG